MSGIYIYSDATEKMAELVTFARQCGKPAHLLVFSQQALQVASGLGADTVTYLTGNSPLAENYAKSVANLLRESEAELFVVISSDRGRDLAARVAGYLDCGMISEAATVAWENSMLVTSRIIYGGAVAEQDATTGFAVVTIAAGKFDAASGEGAKAVMLDAEADERVVLLNSTAVVRTCADLTVAEKIVCVGLGMEKQEEMKIAEDLAAAIGAEIGCTRTIAEERHWLPCYIGISGLTVKPSLMVSIGVSGQVQHVVGMRDSKIVVAINSNEKAPIFQASDYGIVGDMHEIVPRLTEALK